MKSIVLFLLLSKSCSVAPLFFQCTGAPYLCYRIWGLGLRNCFIGSFQAFASPYLAAAGHQKIQQQEMRIWGLGLRNCFREFPGTCAPLSGRSRPPKKPAAGNENLGLGLAKLF